MTEGSTLFPAFQQEKESNSPVAEDTSWLTNKTFPAEELNSQRSSYSAQTFTESSSEEDDNDIVVIPVHEEFKSHRSRESSKSHRSSDSSKARRNRELSKSRSSRESSQSHRREYSKSSITRLIDADDFFGPPLKTVFKEKARVNYCASIDRKPDKNNRCFKQTHITQLARYKVRGIPIGLSSSYLKKRKHTRYFQERKLLKRSGVPVVIDQHEAEKYARYVDNQIDFIPVKSKPKNEASTEKSAEDSKSFEDNENVQNTEKYNIKLREEPSNISLWLEFVDAQDRLAGDLKQGALMEKKVAILDRALQHSAGQLQLLMKKLEICADLWPSDKLNHEWKKLTFYHPDKMDLWWRWLRFSQTYFSGFSVRVAGKAVAKILEKLSLLQQGQMVTHRRPEKLENHMVDLLWSHCCLLKESGYSERAIATFQAVLEFNFNRPRSLNKDELLTFFEPFWDSQVPRFGEEGSQGWATVLINKALSKQDQLPNRDLDTIEESTISESKSAEEAWSKVERLRELSHWKAYDGDPEECEDPERLVLFEDVKPYLLDLPAADSRFRLCVRFLLFLGVPFPTELASSHLKPSYNDSALQPSSLWTNPGESFQWKLCLGDEMEMDSLGQDLLCSKESPLGVGDYRKFVRNTFLQCIKSFGKGAYSAELDWWLLRSERWRVKKAITKAEGKDVKAICKEVKSLAKEILKKEANRNNLRLFCEYALVENDLGSADAAIKILHTTLMTNKAPLCESVLQTYLLLVGLILEKGQSSKEQQKAAEDEVHWILANLGCGSKYKKFSGDRVSGPLLLRSRQGWEKLLQEPSLNKPLENVEGSLEPLSCRVLLWDLSAWACYFSQGLDAARRVLDRALVSARENAMTGDVELEQVYVSYLQLMVYHTATRITPVSLLRTVFTDALAAFPTSPMFLRLFVYVESACMVSGRLRNYFGKTLKVAESVWQPLFAVGAEMLREKRSGQELVGVRHKMQNLLEGVLESPSLSNCTLLWRLYLKISHSLVKEVKGKRKEAQLKHILYRALQHCPWAKVLYMDGIQYIPSMLQELNDLMQEKGVRVRLPLEELKLLQEPLDIVEEEGDNEEVQEEPSEVQEMDTEEKHSEDSERMSSSEESSDSSGVGTEDEEGTVDNMKPSRTEESHTEDPSREMETVEG